LRNAHQVAQETVREIRQLSHQLPSGIRIEVNIDNAVDSLSTEQQLHVYRIVQEALGNAANHSEARNIEVSIRHHPDLLQIQIRDDGVGLPTETGGHGLGLESIRHRVALMSGKVLFQRISPHGLEILIQLPLESPA